MAGKLSPTAQVRLATLEGFQPRVQHIYGLVELYSTVKTNPDQYLMPMQRALDRLKLQLMGAGLDPLSQLCGALALAAKRGLPQSSKVRILREGVGSLKFQLELEMRSVVSEDVAAKRRAAEDAPAS